MKHKEITRKLAIIRKKHLEMISAIVLIESLAKQNIAIRFSNNNHRPKLVQFAADMLLSGE